MSWIQWDVLVGMICFAYREGNWLFRFQELHQELAGNLRIQQQLVHLMLQDRSMLYSIDRIEKYLSLLLGQSHGNPS